MLSLWNIHEQQLYIVFFVLLGFYLIVSQTLFSYGVFLRKQKPVDHQESSDFIPSTILGLLALILGFTFSMAISRFDHRLELVVQEANAIETTFLRSQLLPAKEALPIRKLLQKYVDARLEFFEAGSDLELIKKSEETAAQIQRALWDQLIQITNTDRGPLVAQFASSLNEVIDLQSKRSAAFRNTIPKVVYWVILMITAAGLGCLSFLRGTRKSGERWSIFLLGLLFVTVFTLIRDLDRPRTGTITVSQEPLITLKHSLATKLN